MKKNLHFVLILSILFLCFSCVTGSTSVEVNNPISQVDLDYISIYEGSDHEIRFYLDGGKLEKDVTQLESLFENKEIDDVLPQVNVSRNGLTSNNWVLIKKTDTISEYKIQWPLITYKITYNDEGIIHIQEPLNDEEIIVEEVIKPAVVEDINQDNRPREYTRFDKISIGKPPVDKYGYDFIGWTEDGDNDKEISPFYNIELGSEGDRNLVAVWTPKKVKITYDLDNGSFENEITSEYYYGSNSFTIPNPNKDSYVFVGWVINGEEYISNDNLVVDTLKAEDLHLKAIWIPKQYSINYNIDGIIINDVSEESVIEVNNAIITEPVNPFEYTVEDDFYLLQEQKDGYVFEGWIMKGDDPKNFDLNYHIQEGSTGDKEFVAVWKARNYAIEYDLDGGILENQPNCYTYASEPITIDNPTKKYYEFAGWIFNNEGNPVKDLVIDTNNTTDVNLKAIWIPIDFTISYDLDGGVYSDESNPTSYNVETKDFSLINPVKEGYEFIGWNVEFAKGTYGPEYVLNLSNAGFNFVLEVWKDHAVLTYPNFLNKEQLYDLVYDFGLVNKEDIENIAILIEEGLVTFEYPEGYGTYLIDYFNSTDKQMKSVVVSNASFGDRSYKAVWRLNNYSITYDKNGIIYDGIEKIEEAKNPNSYTINDKFTLINPKKDGYVFKGWIVDGEDTSKAREELSIDIGTTGDKNFIPVWEEKTYSINYDLDGGIIPENKENPNSYTIANENIILSSPKKAGCEFMGWKKVGSSELPRVYYVVKTSELEDINLVAIWRYVKYSITYNLNGGKLSKVNPSSYTIADSDFTLNNPSKNGYKFVGWKEKNSEDSPIIDYSVNTKAMKNIQLEAVWEPIEYRISYNDEGCYYKYDNKNPSTYTIESNDIIIATPYKDGYNFLGWVVAGDRTETLSKRIIIKKGTYGDIKLYAEFEPVRYPIGVITEMQLSIEELGKNNIPRPDWVINTLEEYNGLHLEKAYAKEKDFINSYEAAVKKAQIQISHYYGYELNAIDKNLNDTPYTSLAVETKQEIKGTFVVEYWEDSTGGVWVLLACEK